MATNLSHPYVIVATTGFPDIADIAEVAECKPIYLNGEDPAEFTDIVRDINPWWRNNGITLAHTSYPVV